MLLDPKPLELQDGVIYQKRHTETDSLSYIGRTIDPAEREKQHIKNLTNGGMAKALERPHETTPLVECKCTARQLDVLETKMIQDAAKRGEALENKAKVGVKMPKAEVKHEMIVPPHKFVIKDYSHLFTFTINHDNKIKKFRYKDKLKEEALKEATASRDAVIKAKYF